MKENNEIVEALAREGVVEGIAVRVCKRPAADLADLVSIVYTSLLTMQPEKLRSLAEGGLNFYIVGMIRRQFFSNHNTWYKECVEFAARTATSKLPEHLAENTGED